LFNESHVAQVLPACCVPVRQNIGLSNDQKSLTRGRTDQLWQHFIPLVTLNFDLEL